MSFDTDIFSACFDPDMPGVVPVFLSTDSSEQRMIYAQWWSEPATDAEGYMSLHSTQQRLQAMASDLDGIQRGDQVTINNVTYQAVTKPIDDGHGVATLLLEPVNVS